MKRFSPAVWTFRRKQEEKGRKCRMEYLRDGYDVVCDGEYMLVKPAGRAGTVRVTYTQLVDAIRYGSTIVAVLPDGQEVAKWSPVQFAWEAFTGESKRSVIIVDRAVVLKPEVTPGRKYRAITVMLTPHEYSILLDRLSRYANPWEQVKQMLFSGY